MRIVSSSSILLASLAISSSSYAFAAPVGDVPEPDSTSQSSQPTNTAFSKGRIGTPIAPQEEGSLTPRLNVEPGCPLHNAINGLPYVGPNLGALAGSLSLCSSDPGAGLPKSLVTSTSPDCVAGDILTSLPILGDMLVPIFDAAGFCHHKAINTHSPHRGLSAAEGAQIQQAVQQAIDRIDAAISAEALPADSGLSSVGVVANSSVMPTVSATSMSVNPVMSVKPSGTPSPSTASKAARDLPVAVSAGLPVVMPALPSSPPTPSSISLSMPNPSIIPSLSMNVPKPSTVIPSITAPSIPTTSTQNDDASINVEVPVSTPTSMPTSSMPSYPAPSLPAGATAPTAPLPSDMPPLLKAAIINDIDSLLSSLSVLPTPSPVGASSSTDSPTYSTT